MIDKNSENDAKYMRLALKEAEKGIGLTSPNPTVGCVIVKKGKIIDLSGNQIGEHDGIINYTIGQRKGIKISSSKPLYVININADENTVIVGQKENLDIKKINLRNLNILASRKEFEKNICIKVRSTGKLLNSRVTFKNNHAEVEILDKETGISPGQACVFYSTDEVGDKVLGGGWIDKTFNNNLST